MVKLIVGKKGSGKTKAMIDSINNAKVTSHGDIVFICDGVRHITDIDHKIRLIDMKEYDHETFRVFNAFICGILSQNYDISHIYIDSLLRIVENDTDNIVNFIESVNRLGEKNNVDFVICISADKSELPEQIHQYICWFFENYI